MSQENVAAAKRIYEARNRGNVDAVLAECDPEVTWHPHLATLGGNPIRRHDEVRKYMASPQADWVGFRHEPDVEVPVAHVLTFNGGKCMGYVSYHDRAKALRVAGLKE
jgi:ketosteroid isomerase-like protein